MATYLRNPFKYIIFDYSKIIIFPPKKKKNSVNSFGK